MRRKYLYVAIVAVIVTLFVSAIIFMEHISGKKANIEKKGLTTNARTKQSQSARPALQAPGGAPASVVKDAVSPDGTQALLAQIMDDMKAKLLRETRNEELKKTIISAMNADFSTAAKLYEDYLKRYPLEPGSIEMMSRLALTYSRVGRYEEAIQLLQDAKKQAGTDRFVNTLELNLASVEIESGDLDAAETRLAGIAALPILKENMDDPYAVSPQLFTAPFMLGNILEKRDEMEQADELYADIERRAFDLSKQYPNSTWIPGHATYMCSYRIALLKQRLPDDPQALARAEELYHEAQKNMPPGNKDIMACNYLGDMYHSISTWRTLLGEKAEKVSP